MRLFLVRHGNTFETHDRPVWIGSKEDLPLTEEGRLQIQALGKELNDWVGEDVGVIHAPLLRTSQSAEILAESLEANVTLEADPRLVEVDYGSWCGKTDEEIQAQFGEGILADWQERMIVPSGGQWGESPGELEARIHSFLQKLNEMTEKSETLFVVSSNGILRFMFKKLLGGRVAPKIRTGAYGMLEIATGRKPVVQLWDRRPGNT